MAVLIINSGRCAHGRCFFCGYGRIRGFPPTLQNVNECLGRFFAQLSEREVKVFGSGSFFDEKQIPHASRGYFIGECRRLSVERITLESRPEFITREALSDFKGFDLTIAMGLESSDDALLKRLDKGYTRADFEAAASIIHGMGFKVRSYLLVNPPFVSDVKRSLDASVEYALAHSDSVVLINLLPHASAPLSKIWLSGEWNFLARGEFRKVTSKWASDPRVSVDEETYKFTPSFPDDVRESLEGVGEWYLTHPHFEVWQDYLLRWYAPPEGRVLLFLPCANKKPYSKSMTHANIIRSLEEVGRGRFHEVMLSNAGVIPREFEERYPFESYDWDERKETPAIKKRYMEVTAQRIGDYLRVHGSRYVKVACYLKYDSESYLALKGVALKMGIPLRNLLTEETYDKIKLCPRPLQEHAALDDLKEGLVWCLQNST
jgi:archaeosine synthase alpha-subunit